MLRESSNRVPLWPLLLLFIMVCLFRIGLSVAHGPTAVRTYVVDDGFYYLHIAENIVCGNGSTFDGDSKTNGYQPLWMLAILPVAAFTSAVDPASGTLLYVLWCLLVYIVFVASSATFVAARWGTTAAAVATLVLAHAKVTSLFTNGVEAPLLGLFLLMDLFMLHKCVKESATTKDFLIFGFVAAGTTLARLDHVIFLLPFFLFLLFRIGTDVAARIRSVFVAALPGILLVTAYLLVNWFSFGSAFPISGANKTFAFLNSDKEFLGSFLQRDLIVIALLLTGPALLVFSVFLRLLGKRVICPPPRSLCSFWERHCIPSLFLQ